MKLKISFYSADMNWHAGDGGVIISGHKTITGPKFRIVDILETIRRISETNPEGGKTRAVWYRRLIFYFRSGAWWSMDVALVKSL